MPHIVYARCSVNLPTFAALLGSSVCLRANTTFETTIDFFHSCIISCHAGILSSSQDVRGWLCKYVAVAMMFSINSMPVFACSCNQLGGPYCSKVIFMRISAGPSFCYINVKIMAVSIHCVKDFYTE